MPTDIGLLVTYLLERAQSGHAAEVREIALREVRRRPAETAGLHYVRYACYLVLEDAATGADIVEEMIAAAEREGSAGWLACGLATRAYGLMRESERYGSDYDLDGVLRDMVTAERTVEQETAPIPAVNARVAIAFGYHDLRLYELVAPHYQTAYQISAAERQDNSSCAMWLGNLAELHLYWALELYQIGQDDEAAAHLADAERFGLRAAAEVGGPDAATWRHQGELLAGCAQAYGADPAAAAGRIAEHFGVLRTMGVGAFSILFCAPFHAVALHRSGRHREALDVIEWAVAALTPNVSQVVAAACYRAHAVLLAAAGSAEATAGLRYGDILAATIWQHRLRTLHSVRTMKSMETLRARAESATRALDVDALTGIANRRAFDNAIGAAQRGSGTVTVLLVDTDKFKEINDTRGHAAGDRVLRAIATALTGQVREEDLVARLGGDEFAVLLPDVNEVAAAQIAARMVQAVREIPDSPATISVGVAGAPAGLLPETVVRADAAMYRAKRGGGDAVEPAGPAVLAPAVC